MINNELKVILKDADHNLLFPTGGPHQEQAQILRAIGKILLVLADLELSKAEKKEARNA